MSDYIKKLVEDLFLIYKEREEELSNIDIDEVVDEIMDSLDKKEDTTKEYAHIFICQNEKIAKRVNVFPKDCARVIDNLVILRRLDEFHENKGHTSVIIDNQKYVVPMEYSYSFAFVK